jgi:hypothetical protein
MDQGHYGQHANPLQYGFGGGGVAPHDSLDQWRRDVAVPVLPGHVDGSGSGGQLYQEQEGGATGASQHGGGGGRRRLQGYELRGAGAAQAEERYGERYGGDVRRQLVVGQIGGGADWLG